MRPALFGFRTWCLAIAAVVLAGGAAPCAAGLEELWARPAVTGDWFGGRAWMGAHGLEIEATYTADMVANLRGGLKRTATYLDNLDLTLTGHLIDLIGAPAGTVFLYGVSNHGGDPTRRGVGDAQGVDNIEAPNTIKLYEAWWEKLLCANRLSLLAGLYDLNSEFDVMDSAVTFVNSAFGIGTEFSQSGRNGPSIFPTTAVGVRLRALPFEHLILQAAVLDGVAGDPNDPRGTQVRFDAGDGVLMATEAAFVWSAHDGVEALPAKHRRRIARAGEPLSYRLKVAVGAWLYTTRLPPVDPAATSADRRSRRGDPGVYALADVRVYEEQPASTQGLSLFARAGGADGTVQQFKAYTGGGAVYTGPLPHRDDDRFGVAVATAYNGRPFKRAHKAAGGRAAAAEVAIEWTYRAVLAPWLVVQPDLQYVINPGAVATRRNALVFGLRLEMTL